MPVSGNEEQLWQDHRPGRWPRSGHRCTSGDFGLSLTKSPIVQDQQSAARFAALSSVSLIPRGQPCVENGDAASKQELPAVRSCRKTATESKTKLSSLLVLTIEQER